MDDPDADLKVPSQFFDGKFFGSLQNAFSFLFAMQLTV